MRRKNLLTTLIVSYITLVSCGQDKTIIQSLPPVTEIRIDTVLIEKELPEGVFAIELDHMEFIFKSITGTPFSLKMELFSTSITSTDSSFMFGGREIFPDVIYAIRLRDVGNTFSLVGASPPFFALPK